MIDPMEFISLALDESEDDPRPEQLQEIQHHLSDLERQATRETLALLIDEDDHDDRVRITDLHLMYQQQILKAHQEFVAHLKMVTVLRQINPRPLKDW